MCVVVVRFRCTASFQALLKSWRAVLKLLKDIFYKTVWFRSGGLWFTQCCCLQFLFSIPTPRRGVPVFPYTRQKLSEALRWAQHQLVHGSGPVRQGSFPSCTSDLCLLNVILSVPVSRALPRCAHLQPDAPHVHLCVQRAPAVPALRVRTRA